MNAGSENPLFFISSLFVCSITYLGEHIFIFSVYVLLVVGLEDDWRLGENFTRSRREGG